MLKKIAKYGLIGGLVSALIGVLCLIGLYAYVSPSLPEITGLEKIQLQEPLRVFTKDGALIAEYGNKRRIPLDIQDIPKELQLAFVSSEDDRFYNHPGVDWMGIVRAGWIWISTGDRSQGGSTITMQVARNFFLTREKKLIRKVKEIFLALKITDNLSKDKVLELYLNKIYLGKRSYGVAAAAKVYYGKTVDELTLAEMAMIAGLPKAPSDYNPIRNPERAKIRRNYVLKRMFELEAINETQYNEATAQSITAKIHDIIPDVEAHYLGEMARAKVASLYPDALYDSGLRVYTTLVAPKQQAANTALRTGLLTIDKRHGYRGALGHEKTFDLKTATQEDIDTRLKALKEKHGTKPNMQVALVTQVTRKEVFVALEAGSGSITLENMSWAKKHYNEDVVGPPIKRPSQVLKAGDVIWVGFNEDGQLILNQQPTAEGALVALDPKTGGITALVGGFDFFSSKFNRATQAWRQAGSSFKPFLYSAALDNGFSPGSIINDAPVVFEDRALESKWKPENYSGKIYGPTRLRVALKNSRNLVSIRLLMNLGVGKVRNYASKFGFDRDKQPNDLSLALGSGSTTPLNLATAFASFANDGYRITPYFIERIEDAEGRIIYTQPHKVTCIRCYRKEQKALLAAKAAALGTKSISVIASEGTVSTNEANNIDTSSSSTIKDTVKQIEVEKGSKVTSAQAIIKPTTAFLIRSMLKDVVRSGTARRALKLGRSDLAGKTGTTNDQIDAWFTGFNNDVVASVWIGHDTLKPLGQAETGSSAALPIWVDFMRDALKDSKDTPLIPPPGIISAKIDPVTGLLANPEQTDGIFEYFTEDTKPTQVAPIRGSDGLFTQPIEEGDEPVEPLF